MSTEPTKPVYTLIELTAEQKALALANCTTLRLGELTALVFPGAKPDGRTTEGRSVQAFLAGVEKTVATSSSPIGPIELTDEQKAMIDSLLKEGRVKSSMELAKLVFPSVVVKGLSREWRAVHAYASEHYPDSFSVAEEPVHEVQYTPPDRMQTLIGIVNSYVMTGDVTRKTYNPNTLKPSDERNLKALMAYMRIMRFKYVASTFERQVDRDLFVSTFVRWAHDKSDLTEMEVDDMISAASETVNIAQMEREIQVIKRYHESIMIGDIVDPITGKTKRFTDTDVEMINGVRTKWDQAKGRLKTLMEGLAQTRSKRLGQRDERNNSLLNLFDAWRDDPEWRADLLAIGAREKEEDAAEVKRLKDMDDTIALISGMSEEEASL